MHDNIQMQVDLDNLVDWAEKWQIQFNVSVRLCM